MEKSQSRVTRVCAALNRGKARYLVIGGVACILHGYGRATDDVDILIERTAAATAAPLTTSTSLSSGPKRTPHAW